LDSASGRIALDRDGAPLTIGAPVRRLEDPPLLLGRGRYVGDLIPSGAAHAAVLRSPHAYARLVSIDARATRDAPGVVDVITAADLPPDRTVPIKFPAPSREAEAALQPPLAREFVRYVGEPVAVVVAESRYEAEDALGTIVVEYDPLTAVLDPETALDERMPVLHPHLGGNEIARHSCGEDVDEGVWAGAAVVVEETFELGRHFAVPMEGRGLVAQYESRLGVTVWGPTKVPHFCREAIAGFLDLPAHEVHVIEPDVGGGFGSRGEVYPEDLLVPWLALRTRRPVAWIEDRREHLMTSNHSRAQRHRVRFAASAAGDILAFEDTFWNDQGAYLRGNSVATAELTTGLLPGPYRIPAFRIEGICAMTSTTPTDVYRAPGRYEGTFVRERLVDIAARRLGIDPVDFRLRNLIRKDEMPYDTHTTALGSRTVYDSGDYAGLLRQALAAVGYEGVRARQRERRGGPFLGIGVSCFVEKSGYGPWEYTRVEVSPAGEVVLYTGVSSLGQGISTTLAQVVASELKVGLEAIDVVYGDTDRVPFGIGAFASRGAVVGGSSAHAAVGKLKQKLFRLAAQELEAAEDDLELVEGGVQVRGVPARRLSLATLARAALPGRPLPDEMEPGLAASAVWNVDHMTYPGGACVCTVEVDAETGHVAVRDFAVAYDIGRAINPVIVEGQIHGGIAQGIGGALLEEIRYDEDGQPLCTSFMDYLLPSSMEVPTRISVILDESTPTPLNPLGAKGAGEAGITGVGACIANAVSDALQAFGVEITRLPITPAGLRRLIARAA
jgi:CO/xanthine dehydrogenase Mo-binding subunit